MKFGRVYQDHLLKDGYPQHWVDTSISYRQLKKVIKRVEKELADIGLDIVTLKQVLKTAEEQNKSGSNPTPVRYSLHSDKDEHSPDRSAKPFHPKLLVSVDDATGEPLDFGFTSETLKFLHEAALAQKLTDTTITDAPIAYQSADAAETHSSISNRRRTSRPHRMIEVNLTSDHEFFSILQKELDGLEALQASQQADLESQVHDLGRSVSKVAKPHKSIHKSDLEAWRDIFQLYLDAQIFFATHEQDHGSHDYEKAKKNYDFFRKQIAERGLADQFRKKESGAALHQFLEINRELLRALSFQELNYMAMNKIIKKFDKRTAFNVNPSFARDAHALTLSKDISTAIVQHLSTDLLSIIPQLDDYLCPICCDLAWRPVRLACGHVFCIRCLVVLQREKKVACPMCREQVLLQANIDNLDPALSNFLKMWFPKEVKAKQKSNEYAAGVDEYGDHYLDQGCTIM